MWLHELRSAADVAVADVGGKAAGLARLAAAGVPVPDGFAIDARAFAAIAQIDVGELDAAGHALDAAAARIEHDALPPALEQEVIARAAALGAWVIVRSSAAIEDGAAGGAAGVFASVRTPSADVWAAIRAVWTSALAPLAAAYARRRGAAVPGIAVIVQAIAPGELVTVYTRRPGQPAGDELLVQRAGASELARESRVQPSAIGALALRAEAAIGAAAGADVELAGDVVVQARPIVHPVRRARLAPPPILLAPLRDGRTWTWDVSHNPDPLSPAQAGLVERVDAAGLGAYALRVCAGYLYTSPRDGFAPPASGGAGDLADRAARILAKLDTTLADPPADLAAALDRYVACYAIWANELSPLVSAARAQSRGQAHRPSSVEVTLARAARGELTVADVVAQLGELAPAWDVAAASFGETPAILREAIARASGGAPVPREIETSAAGVMAGVAADLAERDDLYFARMQHVVRRALLDRARAAALHDADDIFWLTLDDALAPELEPDAAHRRASAARAAAARSSAWDMPLVVGPAPATAAASAHAPAATVLRGVGTGPRVTGRAVRYATLAGAAFANAGDVVVVRAVTPALAMFVGRCAAIVSETGGLLDHGAALARELGITCVVGCAGAWHELADGTLVTVDGDGGSVYSSSS